MLLGQEENGRVHSRIQEASLQSPTELGKVLQQDQRVLGPINNKIPFQGHRRGRGKGFGFRIPVLGYYRMQILDQPA